MVQFKNYQGITTFDKKKPVSLSYTMEHEENEHWWLAEENKGQVVYVPVAHPMNIVDERQSRKREFIVPLYLSNR